MKLTKALFVLALALALAVPAYAETQNVKVSGSIDMYGIARNHYDFTDGNDAGTVAVGTPVPGNPNPQSAVFRSEGDSFFMSITQVGVNAELTDNVSTVINLVNQRDWNADVAGTGAVNTTEEFDIILDLAYVQMKEIFYAPLTLTIGRQDLLFGRGFIVGWNAQDPSGTLIADEFTQVQSFDALRATLDFNPWTVDLVYSKLNENSHDPEDDRDLYIANANYKFAEYNAVAEGYYMNESDRATVSGAAGAVNNDTQILGGRVQFDPISPLTLGAELAYQFGNYRTGVAVPERDREAWGFDLFGEYRFDGAYKPMLGLQYVSLSGEDDLGPGAVGDYSSWNGGFRGPIYGWIHDYKELYYITGQANDQVAGQNQQHISIYGSLNPLEDLKLSANFWHFWATDDMHQTITNPGTGVLSSDIGNELDTALTYAYTEDVTFTLMANWFMPGDLYSAPNDETASEYVSEVKVLF